MLQAFINTLKVKDLRNRLMFTALIIVLVRFASSIPCPGVDPAALEGFMAELSAGSKDGGGVMNLSTGTNFPFSAASSLSVDLRNVS